MKKDHQNKNEQLRQTAVSGSTDHDEWLRKYKKTKSGKIFDLRYEFESLNNPYALSGKKADINSYSASAMWIMAKGTRFEEDIKVFIEALSPDFFSDDSE